MGIVCGRGAVGAEKVLPYTQKYPETLNLGYQIPSIVLAVTRTGLSFPEVLTP